VVSYIFIAISKSSLLNASHLTDFPDSTRLHQELDYKAGIELSDQQHELGKQ
jgi:hypothetical protein